MNKRIITFAMLVVCIATQAQVGIGTSTPSTNSDLTLGSTNKGLLLNRVALTGTTDATTVGNAVAGMVVYNTTTVSDVTPGLYINNGVKWLVSGTGTTTTTTTTTTTGSGLVSSGGFNSAILGYNPMPAASRVVPATFDGCAVAELGIKTYNINGHKYAAYQMGCGVTWLQAFEFAKQLGGYLVTMTGNTERIWVHTNIVDGFTMNSNIWIGFNKVSTPGNNANLQWITGEYFVIDWTTTPATTENWFYPGEPNNWGGNEGASHIWNNNQNEFGGTARYWNDGPGQNTEGNGVPQDQLIIEFNE